MHLNDLNVNIPRRFVHDCQLGEQHNDDEIYSPYDSFHKQLWLRLKASFLVSRFEGTQYYFRSRYALKRERNRQRNTRRYKHVIHPFSPFHRVRKFVLAFVWLFLFFVEPYLGTFVPEKFSSTKHEALDHVLLVLNLLLLIDVALRFITGHPIDKTRMCNLERKFIVVQYVKTYFFFDLIPTLHYFFFYFSAKLDPRVRLVLYFLCPKLRLVRIGTVSRTLDLIFLYFKINEAIHYVLLLFLYTLIFLQQLTCLLGLPWVFENQFELNRNDSWMFQFEEIMKTDKSQEYIYFRKYVHHLSYVSTHFFGGGLYYFESDDSSEQFILALILMCGMIFYIFTIAKILQFFGVMNISETKFEEINTQLNDYMIRKNFPKPLKKRINRYYDYKFHKKFFSEEKILQKLTEHLRMEILLYSCQNMIQQVKIFKGLSKSAVGCVLALLKQEICIADDLVFSQEDSDDSLYFILHGTCAIKLNTGREIMHIQDGDYFGDSSRVDAAATQFLYSVVALELCEIYILKKQDIKYCCKHYPEIVYKLEGMGKIKSKLYNQMFAISQDDEDKIGDILDELKQGKILRRGVKRDEL